VRQSSNGMETQADQQVRDELLHAISNCDLDLKPDPKQKYYDVHPFLLLPEDALFIDSAYQCILKRSPDSEGRNSYNGWLAKGGLRQQVLADLLLSEEAQQHEVEMVHIQSFLAAQRIKRKSNLAARLLSPALWFLEHSLNRIQRARARRMRPQLAREQAFRLSIRTIHQELETLAKGAGQEIQDLKHRVEMLENQNAQLRSQYRLLKSRGVSGGINPELLQKNDPSAADPDKQRSQRQADFNDFYLEFEIAFRGSREAIRERLAHYLPFLPDAASGAARVVDLGCGRGEWLAMLKTSGYSARGLDSSPVMRQICRDQGLSVSGEPMHRWLKDQPDASLCAITAFHLAEHLPFEYLLALVMEAKRLLQPGGVLILETQNPESLRVSAYAFYHDPTHRNPLTPELLEFMAHYAGFESVRLQRLSQVPENLHIREQTETAVAFNRLLNAPRDLALIAFQPLSA